MVYAVMAVVAFRNTARRDAVAGNVTARLAQEVPWGQAKVEPRTVGIEGEGSPGLYIEVRFNTEAEQLAFWNDVVAAFGSGINGPTTGSWFARHNCTHDDDESVTSCIVTEEIVL